MRQLVSEDILPILKYSAKKYSDWLLAGLNDYSLEREDAFYPLSDLTIYSEGVIQDFMGAVYWALDANARIRFRKAVALLLNALAPEVPEGLDECHRVLPPLLRFVAKYNIDCIDAIHRLTRSPQIVGDDRTLLLIIEAAVGLSKLPKSEELLRWLVAHPRIKDEHIPIILIAQANAACGDNVRFLGNAWGRLERLAVSPHVNVLPELWGALKNRVSSAQLENAFAKHMRANALSRLPGIFPGLTLRVGSRHKDEIRFQANFRDKKTRIEVRPEQIWRGEEARLHTAIAEHSRRLDIPS